MKKSHTYYEELGISRDAPSEVVEAAYKALHQKYHADNNPNNPDAKRILRTINTAYETLSNPMRRSEYDKQININVNQSNVSSNNNIEKKENKHTNHQNINSSRKFGSEKLNSNFWSLNSRVTRKKYALLYIPIILILGIFKGVIKEMYIGGMVFTDFSYSIGFFLITLTLISFAQFLKIKRLHDCNLSGWFSLAPFFSFIILFLKGTDGANIYGFDPRKNLNIQTTPHDGFKKDRSIPYIFIFFVILTAYITYILTESDIEKNNHQTSQLSTPKTVDSYSENRNLRVTNSPPIIINSKLDLNQAKRNYNYVVSTFNKTWNNLSLETQNYLKEEQRKVDLERDSFCRAESSKLNKTESIREAYRFNCEARLLKERIEYLQEVNTKKYLPQSSSQSLETKPEIMKSYNTNINPIKAKQDYDLAVSNINKIWNSFPQNIQTRLRDEQREINSERESFCRSESSKASNTEKIQEAYRYDCEAKLLNERASYLEKEFGEFIHQSILSKNIEATSELSAGDDLKSSIRIQNKKNIDFLNNDYPDHSHSLEDEQIIYADLNNDGIKDAVVGLSYCEKTSCHMTTMSYNLVIFIGTGNDKFEYLDTKSLGLYGSIDVDKKGIINTKVYKYSDDDPSCCPSDEANTSYIIRNNSLVEIN